MGIKSIERYLWAQKVMHKMLFIWAQDGHKMVHTDVVYGDRWAQMMHTDIVYWGTRWAQDEHKMLFISTRCYL